MHWLRESPVVTVLAILIAAGVAIATGLRLTGLASGIWPVASFTAFVPYLVPIALLAAFVVGALGRLAPAVVLAICSVVLAATVLGRTRPTDQPQAAGTQVRITSANLLKGQADPHALAEIVGRRRPDVLVLQEYTPGTKAKLRAAGVFDDLPHVVLRPPGGRTDTVVASRWPLTQLDVDGLPDVYLAVRAELPPTPEQPQGRSLPLVSAHPTPPLHPSNQQSWQDWLAALPGPQGPLQGGLIAGDFNATLDHQQFRRVLDRGWRDTADELGEGLRPTWRGKARLTPAGALKLTIDHVLIPPGAAAKDYAIDPLAGSDHRAVSATVVLPAESAADRR